MRSQPSTPLFLGLSAVLAASVVLPLPDARGEIAHLPAFCPFYRLTGLPCPGCGLTRAFVCLGHGQVLAALHWHPLGWVLYALCLAVWLRAGLSWALRRELITLTPRVSRAVSVFILAAVLIVGFARMAYLLAHGVPF